MLFTRINRPWNLLTAEYPPLTYNVDGFKSRVNKPLLSLIFLNSFHIYFLSFFFFSCNVITCRDCSVLCGVNPD